MAEKEIIEFPKMLYRMDPGNVLKTLVVQSAEEQKEAGKDWSETIPKPKGRPAGKKAESEDEA